MLFSIEILNFDADKWNTKPEGSKLLWNWELINTSNTEMM